MTDNFEAPPLTRRERRERERAAAESVAGSAQGADAGAVEADASAGVDSVEQELTAPEVAPEAVAGDHTSDDAADGPDAESSAEETSAADEDVAHELEASNTSWSDSTEGMAATEALDMTDVVSDKGGFGAARAWPGATEHAPEDAAAETAEPVVEEAGAHESSPSSGIGRFFGRRRPDPVVQSQDSVDSIESVSDVPAADDTAGDDTAVADESGQTEEVVAADVDAVLEMLDDDTDASGKSESTESAPAAEASADAANDAGVAKAADESSVSKPQLTLDEREVEELDEAAIASIEVDEVPVSDSERVSSRWVAAATPAQLEDARAEAEAEADAEEIVFEPAPEAPEESAFGASRRTGRTPVVVNVVEDTSEHHIADLRGEDTQSIATASSVGTGTSAITANALVLPASGAHEPITIEGQDGVIVTGSIDLPDGFASSGRSRGTFDTADVDATIDDPGELRTPETQPVRASKAVSSYANARVQIAPTRRSSSAMVMALGIGGGAVAVGVGTVAILGIVNGWF